MRVVVLPEAAGERLDRFLAVCEGVGLSCGGGAPAGRRSSARGRGETAEEPPARRRGGAGARAPGASGILLEPEPVEGPASSTRTSTSSSSTSRLGVVVHPSVGHAHGTLVHGLLSQAIEGGEEPERPGDAPARPRHLRAPCRRARRSAPATSRPAAPTRARPRVRRARPRAAALAGGRIEAPIGRDRRDLDPAVAGHRFASATPRPPSSC